MNWNLNGLFNPENRFWTRIETIMDLCLLGILWAVCSLPLITAGAAASGLFCYTLKLARRQEGYVCRTFFQGFRRCFAAATVLWLITAAVGAALVFSLYCCQFLPFGAGGRWGARGLLGCLLLLYLLTVPYLFSLTAAVRMPMGETAARAFVLAVGNLPISVTILVLYGLCAAAVWFVPALFMVWFALASYAASHFLCFVFRQYLRQEDDNS